MRQSRTSSRRFSEYRERIRSDDTWSTRGSAEPNAKKDKLKRSRSFWKLFTSFWRLTNIGVCNGHKSLIAVRGDCNVRIVTGVQVWKIAIHS